MTLLLSSNSRLAFDEPVQEGNLYDLLENVAQFYEQQLPHSQKGKKLLLNSVD